MSPRVAAIPLLLLGLLGCTVALIDPRFSLPGIAVGIVAFFAAGTLSSNAWQLAKSLRPLLGKPLRFEVWGVAADADARFEIETASAFGAGLLIHLHRVPGGPRLLLKVAQPRAARREDGLLEIGEAAYVSWAGTRLARVVGAPALVIRG